MAKEPKFSRKIVMRCNSLLLPVFPFLLSQDNHFPLFLLVYFDISTWLHFYFPVVDVATMY